MLGPVLVTLVVFVIVASYIGIVNRMLRSDEHWSESNHLKPVKKPSNQPVPTAIPRPVHA